MTVEGVEYTKHLEIKDIGIDDEDRYSIYVDVSDIHLNRSGQMHGGMVATLLDAALGRAVYAQLPDDCVCPTVEMKVNYFRPGLQGRLTARGKLLNRSKTLAYAEGEVLNEEGKLLAKASATFYIRKTSQVLNPITRAKPVLPAREI